MDIQTIRHLQSIKNYKLNPKQQAFLDRYEEEERAKTRKSRKKPRKTRKTRVTTQEMTQNDITTDEVTKE